MSSMEIDVHDGCYPGGTTSVPEIDISMSKTGVGLLSHKSIRALRFLDDDDLSVPEIMKVLVALNGARHFPRMFLLSKHT
jgi:hypothetical protein